MARPKKAEDMVRVEIVRDGVFIAEDVRRDTGAIEAVEPRFAEELVKMGLAKRV